MNIKFEVFDERIGKVVASSWEHNTVLHIMRSFNRDGFAWVVENNDGERIADSQDKYLSLDLVFDFTAD